MKCFPSWWTQPEGRMSSDTVSTWLAWTAHRLVSSTNHTSEASFAFYKAPRAALWKHRSVLRIRGISHTRPWRKSLWIGSVAFWLNLISPSATLPGLWRFFTPPIEGALLRADFVANCFLDACMSQDIRDPLTSSLLWAAVQRAKGSSGTVVRNTIQSHHRLVLSESLALSRLTSPGLK